MKTDMDYKENQGSATWLTTILAAYSPHFKILEQYCAFIVDSFLPEIKPWMIKYLEKYHKNKEETINTTPHQKKPFYQFFLTSSQ